mmetsp:Transcript_1565/g.3967  ORF Transcript_1565/g.3967 Transcript_1565/m.3967 type:complete len:521 (-) Transcript_1565:44-1606(-)
MMEALRLQADAPAVPAPAGRRLREESESFTRARLEALAPERRVLLSFTNRVRLDFALTWAHHVRSLTMSNWMIGATDAPALEGLRRYRLPRFDMQTNLPQGEWPWGSPSFKALGPHKIELIYKCLLWDVEVIIADIDALVLREPFAYMARWPDASFLTTSDHLGNTTADGGLEDHGGIHTAFNIGYMFFRKSALPLVEEWRKTILEKPTVRWDQGEFNRLARKQWQPRRKDGLSDPRLFWSYENRVIGGVLPISLFCGGHNYFVSQFPQRAGVQPYSIHTTYQYGGAPGKRHRLREAKVWIDPPAYYNPSGLLVYPPDVSRSLIYPAGGMTTKGHIALIKHQLKQIKQALALARYLDRTLILPPVVCGYDKAWYPLASGRARGVFPGTHAWAVPIFNCPLDHFLEPASLRAPVREYSFLSNPRTPASVTSSVASVELGAQHTLAALKLKYASTKVLNVTNLPSVDVLARLLTKPQAKEFRRLFGNVGGSWCCAPNQDRSQGMPSAAYFRLINNQGGRGLG